METKASFIEPKKVLVETSQEDRIILGFASDYQFKLETQTDFNFLDFLSSLFDKYYQCDDSVIMGEISRQLMLNHCESVFYFQTDRNRERVRIGERIREIRQEKNIDAKTLAYQASIDAANLCRIEQGKYSPGFDVLTKIANALGMRIDFVKL